MQYESTGSYKAFSYKCESPEGSLIKMDVMRNEGDGTEGTDRPNVNTSRGENFIQPIQYNRSRIYKLIIATAVVGLLALVTFITTLALNLPEKSGWKKGLDAQAQQGSGLAESLAESNRKISELQKQVEVLTSEESKYFQLSDMLNATLTRIRQLENKTQTLEDKTDEITPLSKRIVEAENGLKQLQMSSKVLEAKSKDCCSNMTTALFEARNDITKLQNRNEGNALDDAKYFGMANLMNETAKEVEKLQSKSEGWNATYLSMEMRLQHNLQYIVHLENQTKALLVWADEQPDASDRLEEMMRIMNRYNTSDVFERQSQKLIELSTTLSETNVTLRQLLHESGYCPLKYDGKCFWIARRLNPRVTFQQGRDICATLGGKPANIYSELHHNMVMEYLRAIAIESNDDIYAWTGMTYSFPTRAAYLSDGRRAPFVKWYPGNPKTSSCCSIALRPREDWRHSKQDMYTTTPTSTKKAVICEK